MNRPLEIRDVENISLEASDDNSDMYPQLVAQFSCQHEKNSDCISYSFGFKFVCCSVVLMINVTYAAIEGISVTVTTPYVSGVILQKCSHLHIQSNTYIGIEAERAVIELSVTVGITAYESSDIEMDSLEASNFTFGVALSKSRNTSMINVSAVHNGYDGIWLDNSTDPSTMNVCAAHNGWNGIWLYRCTNTSMMKVSAVHNGRDGIYLDYSTDTRMMNVSAVHNGWYGIGLHHSTDISMMNVSAVHNGIYLDYSTDTSMMNVSAAHNEHDGIHLDYSTDTSMMNVSAAHNEHDGIHLDHSTDTSMVNVSLQLPVDCSCIAWPDLSRLRVLHLGISGERNWKLSSLLHGLKLITLKINIYESVLCREDCIALAQLLLPSSCLENVYIEACGEFCITSEIQFKESQSPLLAIGNLNTSQLVIEMTIFDNKIQDYLGYCIAYSSCHWMLTFNNRTRNNFKTVTDAACKSYNNKASLRVVVLRGGVDGKYFNSKQKIVHQPLSISTEDLNALFTAHAESGGTVAGATSRLFLYCMARPFSITSAAFRN